MRGATGDCVLRKRGSRAEEWRTVSSPRYRRALAGCATGPTAHGRRPNDEHVQVGDRADAAGMVRRGDDVAIWGNEPILAYDAVLVASARRAAVGAPPRVVDRPLGSPGANWPVGYPVADTSEIWLWIACTLSETPSQP